MSERPTIVIAGAGIGGLTAALTVARAGFRVIVCERAAELAEIGAGIQLSPNAGRVLAGLDLDSPIASVAVEPEALEIRRGSDGELISSLPVSEFRRRYGFPYRVIHRGDLQAILLGAVAAHPEIELRLATPVTGFTVLASSIVVVLDGGGTGEEAAGLIAADGVWSSLRAKIAPRPAVPTGRTAWRALISAADAPAVLRADRVCLWLSPTVHLVAYPVVKGAAINLVAIVHEDWRGEGWNAPGDPAELAGYFEAWQPDLRAIFATAIAWRKWALTAVDPAGPWVSGPVALLGDAAHAMEPYLAQGAAMAIEDAAVLGQALAAKPSDVPAALLAYESNRRARVSRCWQAAKSTGDYYHLGPAAGSVRDLFLKFAAAPMVLSRNDWLFAWTPPR